MAAVKSLVSRVLLWLGVAAFCAALAVACSVAQTPEVQAAAQSPPAPPPLAAPMGSVAARGLAYVRAACADCHQVEPAGPQPPYSGAPAFHKVAITPGMTTIALLAWLHTSHPTMPNLVVPRDRLDDVLAYFEYLRATGKEPQKQPQ